MAHTAPPVPPHTVAPSRIVATPPHTVDPSRRIVLAGASGITQLPLLTGGAN